MMTADDLIAFEAEVADAFNAGKIKAPVHLSGSVDNIQETTLIEIFRNIHSDDWKFSTWRNHLHALLSGIPKDWVMKEIMEGRSMNLNSAKHNFFTSAIVGGILPIAVGVAYALKMQGSTKKVYCFLGDMTSTAGIFHESSRYAIHNDLPINFIIEDNGMSTDTPSIKAWGTDFMRHIPITRYEYERTYPHVNAGQHVTFL